VNDIASVALDHLPIAAVVVRMHGQRPTITHANRAMASLSGMRQEALGGASLELLLPSEDLSVIFRPGAQGHRGEAVLTTASGDRLPVTLEAASLPGHGSVGAVVLFQEDRVRHDKERALRVSAKRLQDIVDNVNALIYLKAADGRYIFINHHYEEFLDVRREEVQGKDDFDLWPEHIASSYTANDNAVLTSRQPMEFEEPIPGKDGTPGMWLSLKFPLYNEEGVPYAVAGISTDISDRNRAEAMIRSAKDEAERANQAKSDFLSRMSHELRTPLNSIIGFSQLVQLEDLQDETADNVSHIVRAGRHLLTLINEVLEISRIESGIKAMSVEPIHACDPLNEAFELVRPLAAAKNIEMARDLHAALYKFVLADYQRLKQVLLNVLMNAVKYNREDGMITVTTEVIDTRMRFRVIDTGLGMDEADVERVFVPFERLDFTSSDIEGTGLGLTLSRSLIEAMGGRIGVERTVKGKGSVFFVDVDLTEQPSLETVLRATAPEPASQSRPQLEQITIVYIEDNLANLELVERILARQGEQKVIPAMQGLLGIELAALHQPDVILLDLHLPDIDGEEVLHRLKAHESTREIPVLILSADATPSQITRLKAAGATDYITKPLDIVAFLNALKAAVGRP
jgi:PAS domain S-box-containing protein